MRMSDWSSDVCSSDLKTGGLTEAWHLLRAARREGFKVMVGCMVCSSLGIAPALELAREAAFVDLDGPFWLQHDHPAGVQLQDRKRVLSGKSVSVRVDLGGRRIIKKKKITRNSM